MRKKYFLFIILNTISSFALSGQDQETFLILKNNVWDTRLGVEENLIHFKESDLDPFVEKLREDKKFKIRPLDGIALEAPAEYYGNNIESLSEFLYTVLLNLNEESINDLQNLKMNKEGIFLDNGWQFTYRGERFFIITFAPFYGINSSRYNYGGKNYVILFQPEISFKSFLSKNPKMRLNQKEKVREIFNKNDQNYEGKIVPQFDRNIKAHEAPRYIKPLDSTLSYPIEWWKRDQTIQKKLTSEEIDLDYDTEVGGPINCTLM
jgi:hypothetical protein